MRAFGVRVCKGLLYSCVHSTLAAFASSICLFRSAIGSNVGCVGGSGLGLAVSVGSDISSTISNPPKAGALSFFSVLFLFFLEALDSRGRGAH